MLLPTFIAGKIHTPMEYKGELTSYDMRLRCVVEGSGERVLGAQAHADDYPIPGVSWTCLPMLFM